MSKEAVSEVSYPVAPGSTVLHVQTVYTQPIAG